MTAPKVLYSPKAERAMIGACLLSYEAREVLRRELTPEDFYVVKYRDIAAALLELHRLGHQVDELTVASWVADHLGSEAMARMGGLAELAAIMGDLPNSRSAPTYAARIRDRSARRQTKAILTAAGDRVDDLAVDVEEILDDVGGRLRQIDTAGGNDPPPLNIEEFLMDPRPYDWLVPNLLERGDRVILTSAEGGGKSTLLRQLAVQLAAGFHPFARQTQEPVPTLHMDLENSHQQAQRGLRRLYEVARSPNYQVRLGEAPPRAFDPTLVSIEVRPQGLDLLTRRDRQWFASRIEQCRPAVVMTGPIYKMHHGEPTEEKPAKTVADFLDELRTHYGFALILEAHSPHGSDGGKQRTLRPYGASLWMRWPEFGFGIRKLADGIDFELQSWRGPRDAARLWPSKIRYGTGWYWINSLLSDYDEPTEEKF